jgi:hypothetical protein
MTQPKAGSPTASPRRIPHFASREEEAQWWDTPDIADYQDELQPVRARFAKNLSQGITIRLDPKPWRSCAPKPIKKASRRLP